jgi:hypothetical protein
MSRSVSILAAISAQRKTHRQIASGGGLGELAYECFTSSVPVLQKTRNSCRHACACRCNSCALLDGGIHKIADTSLPVGGVSGKFKISMLDIEIAALTLF